ncbi:MAG TPA: ribonuclease domain-containing protein [Pseudoxanthomonas sp.]|nr:ribonuclease domain-containing protein [Pseudoxanthomonas sp.]
MPLRSRSRRKSGVRKPALIALVLVVLLSGWFWQQNRARHAAVDDPAPAATQAADAGNSQPLPLPPLETTGHGSQTNAAPAASAPTGPALPAFLPPEAHATLRLIAQGGPFPHSQDGSVFGNRERHLPSKPRGYYREYTVETPGLGHRGARRIITGGQPPDVYYYTDDHYDSFRSFQVAR